MVPIFFSFFFFFVVVVVVVPALVVLYVAVLRDCSISSLPSLILLKLWLIIEPILVILKIDYRFSRR